MSQRGVDPDQLFATIERLEDRVDDLEAQNQRLQNGLNVAHDRIDELEDDLDDAHDALQEYVDEELAQREQQARTRRVDFNRRLTTVERELDVDQGTAVEDDDGLTPFGILAKVGPEAVSDSPGPTLRRAYAIALHYQDWGEVRTNRKYGRHLLLSTKQHSLRTHIESARGEDLAWRQVYRAMDEIARLGGDAIVLDESYAGETDYGKALVFGGGTER